MCLWMAPDNLIQHFTKKVVCIYLSLIWNTCSPDNKLFFCNKGIGISRVFLDWWGFPVALLPLALPLSSWSWSAWVPRLFAFVTPIVLVKVRWLFGHLHMWRRLLRIPWSLIVIIPVPWRSRDMLFLPHILESQSCRQCLGLWRHGQHSSSGRCGWCWPQSQTHFLWRGLLSTLFAWRRRWRNTWESFPNRPSCWLGGSSTSSFIIL